VHLVDLPDVAAEVVQRVVTVASGPSGLAQASYDGRIGHPVLLGPDHWETLLSVASGDRGASALLASRPHMEVECGDLAGGHDVDGPDLRR
jgi:CTP:molybdopterin cytidylyltransferase MocA